MGRFRLLNETLAASTLIFAISTGAFAADVNGEAAFKCGLDAYKNKAYQLAADQFRLSVANGNKSPQVWLYAGHCFNCQGQYPQAYKTYETLVKNFPGTPEAKIAMQGMQQTKGKPAAAPAAVPVTPAPPGATAAATPAPAALPPDALKDLSKRIVVTPPAFGHPKVSQASVKAIIDGVNSLTPIMRKKLDDSGACFNISPNIIDRWPKTLDDLDESKDDKTMAENMGRIYGLEMCIYERPKLRGTTALGEATTPALIKHGAINMCFQVLDDMWVISKDPNLRKAWERDKESIPEEDAGRLWTYCKTDDWGPRETCSDLTGALLGGGNEYASDLKRYFPNVTKFLKTKLQIR